MNIEKAKEIIDRDYEEEVRERLNYDYRRGGRVTEYADGSVCFHNDDEESPCDSCSLGGAYCEGCTELE